MAADAQTDETGAGPGFWRAGVSAASRRMANMELDKKLTPLLEHGKQAASSGARTVGQMGGQARELVTQRQLWADQQALIDQVLEVLTLQQALIEDLRARVAHLEGDA